MNGTTSKNTTVDGETREGVKQIVTTTVNLVGTQESDPKHIMNGNYDEEEDENALERQRDIEAAEATAVDEMFATMNEKNVTVGKGWFIPSLADMHIESIAVGDRFYCEPRQKDQDPTDVPKDHPFRAILGVLHAGEKNLGRGDMKTIRLYAYSLSCPYLIDTLIHYRKFFEIRVIMHPAVHSLKMIKKFIDNIPVNEETGNPRVGLEMIEFRVADVSHNTMASMHRKELVMEELMVVGSYNYSLAARCFHWETIIIAETREDDILRFDAAWDDLQERVLSIYNPDIRLFPPKEQSALSDFIRSLPAVPRREVINPYKKARTTRRQS